MLWLLAAPDCDSLNAREPEALAAAPAQCRTKDGDARDGRHRRGEPPNSGLLIYAALVADAALHRPDQNCDSDDDAVDGEGDEPVLAHPVHEPDHHAISNDEGNGEADQ
jgi:hypothetical protein